MRLNIILITGTKANSTSYSTNWPLYVQSMLCHILHRRLRSDGLARGKEFCDITRGKIRCLPDAIGGTFSFNVKEIGEHLSNKNDLVATRQTTMRILWR